VRRLAAVFLLSMFLALPASAHPCGKPARHRGKLSSTTAPAPEAERAITGLGFHSTEAPIGARIGLTEYLSLDVGVGFNSRDRNDRTTFDVGLPYTVKEWPCLRALIRPGFTHENQECVGGDINTTTLSAELEGEAFLCKQISVSAALGVAHESRDLPGVADNETRTYSTGGEFTRVGMHLYLWR